VTAWLAAWLGGGTVLILAVWLVLHLPIRVNAATRYALWWGAYATLIVFGWMLLPRAGLAAESVSVNTTRVASTMVLVHPLPSIVLSLIWITWASVAAVRIVRMLLSIGGLHRLKRVCRPLPADVHARLIDALQPCGRQVRFALCDALRGPAVLGLKDPCIAMPESLLLGLSESDLRQVIIHENAHVQRRDDWMRLLQELVEALLWIHPAVLLVRRGLNLEREVACDDWVIARTRSPREYAACLSRLAERHSTKVPSFASGFFGVQSDLVRRVERLLRQTPSPRRGMSSSAAAAGALVLCAFTAFLRAFPVVVEATPVRDSMQAQMAALRPPFSMQAALPALGDAGVLPGGTSEHVAVNAQANAKRNATTKHERSVTKQQADTGNAGGERSGPVERPAVDQVPVLVPVTVVQPVVPTPPQPARSQVVSATQGVVRASVGAGDAARKAGVAFANRFVRAGSSVAAKF
jgi:beta-lactamase regulating signal transducer with metallopeptidase domain